MKKVIELICFLFILSGVHIKAAFIFEQFRELENKIPYIKLAKLPTPIYRCCYLEKVLEHNALFMKRDDLTGPDHSYGGNKVRKLEFLLADAIEKGAKKVITFGCAGSNHAVATACYSQKLGLDCLLMLKDQPNSAVVRQNILLDRSFNAKVDLFPNNEMRDLALNVILTNATDAYFIPTGGSVPLGVLGYVNAAFELKNQIQNGMMPEPDVIYVPIGSCGTTAGLLLGFGLAKIHSKIVAVAVEPEEYTAAIEEGVQKLFFETNKLLHRFSPSIPLMDFPYEQLHINKNFCGTQYGLWLPSGNAAMQLMFAKEGISLEGTYSAKACAALISDIEKGLIKRDEIVLFWNTYCGLDFSFMIDQVDYKTLEPNLHHYFEECCVGIIGK